MSLKRTSTALALLLVSQVTFANDNGDEPPPPPPEEPSIIEIIIQSLTPGGTYQPPP